MRANRYCILEFAFNREVKMNIAYVYIYLVIGGFSNVNGHYVFADSKEK